MKKSIIIYADCIAILEELTYEQAGRLFKAILSYVNDEPVTEIQDDPAVKMAYKVLKNQIDRDAVKYEVICKKRSEAGKRHRGNQYTRNGTNGTSVPKMEQTEQNGTNGTDNVNENDNESTNVDSKKETPTTVGGKENAAAVAATLSKVRSIEERQKDFYDTLRPYVNKYPKEMLRAFYDWWSEPNRSKTKMRVELEKTWDLSRRLATWNRKDEERKFNGTNRTNDSAAQTVNAAAAAVSELLADNE